jgi:hypothetical protein
MPPETLAQSLPGILNNIGDWIVPAIIVIIMFGGWIKGMLGTIKKKQQERRRQEFGGLRGDRPDPSDMEAVLAERRRRLAESGGASSHARSQEPTVIQLDDPSPANLTMAERIARARAQAQYQQRKQRLQQPGGAAGTPTAAPPSPAPRPQPRPGQRTQPQPQPRPQPSRPTPPRPPARPQPQPARAASQPPRQPFPQAPPRPESPHGRRSLSTEEPAAATPTGRLPIDQTAVGTGNALPHVREGASPVVEKLPRLNRAELRRAVILKELFSPPVSMRDPLQDDRPL